MTRDEIIQFFARREECWKARDPAAVTAGHAADGVLEGPLTGRAVGRPAIEKVYRGLFTSFPDFLIASSDLIIDGDRAVQIATASGTDTGGFMDLPPTGKRFSFPIVMVHTLKDGCVAHEKVVYDFTGWLLQVGVLKAKPR